MLRDFFKKADIFLLLALLMLGGASIFVLRHPGNAAEAVTLTVDGEIYGVYSLRLDREVRVDSEYGHNTVVIRGGTVFVIDSDCPGGDCTHFSPISRPGQSILCLPHRLCVAIGGENELGADVVIG